MQETIPKIEYDSAYNMLETILTQRVEDIELSDTIPPLDDIADSNKVFKGKLSILFVDMRKSTDLTDELKSKKMVKVYRSFIRMIVQAIRYCNGQSRQFAGDGVLGVFQDDLDDSKDISDNKINPINSCEKAIRAARYILTLIDYCLNPQLKKYMGDISIGCGVGICTGTVMVTKIGMRGKEADDTAENEMGIVWVGQTTNYASRLCSLSAPREIFIDEETYKNIPSNTELWKKETRIKGTKPFTGYIASEYYLSLPDGVDIEPIISNDTTETNNSFIQGIFDETEDRVLHLVDEVSKKSAELADKLKNVESKEKQLNERERKLSQRENNLSLLELECEFNLLLDFIGTVSGKFTDEQIRSIGKDYWNKNINRVKELSKKSDNKIWGYQSSWIADIYEALEQYEDFYHEVCNMAKNGFYISEYDIKKILDNTYFRTALKDTLQEYISDNRNSDTSDSYLKLLNLMGE